jgi:hypothetical protein
MYISIYILAYIYSIFPTRSHTYTRGRPHKRLPVRVRANTFAPAHRRRRRTQRPDRIADRESATAGGARRRLKAAHTWVKSLTDAVFHAPMGALNTYALLNTCEPNTHADHANGKCSHGSARIRVRLNPPAHARAHTWARLARGRVCGARTHR